MKAFKTSDFAALIGIDWAYQKHDICEIPLDTRKVNLSVISSQPKSIYTWATDLLKRYPNQKVAVACELKKGPLVYALEQFDHIVIFPLNPATVAKYRKAFAQSGAKDDPSDAFIQAEMLDRHMDRLRPIEPEDPDIRSLKLLLEYRRKLVQDRVDITNRMSTFLKCYYPQALDWFKEKDTMIFCNFLTKWPSLTQVTRARKTTLIKFFNDNNSRYNAVNERRIEAIKDAFPLTEDPGIIEPNRIMIELLVPQLRCLLEAIERMDDEIKVRYKQQNDKNIFDSFPGAGPQLAPRLLVAFGSKRSRYQDASEIQRYAGIAPVLERSGQKSWTHWRHSCPTFLRQTFVEWAGQSVRFSFWAKAYYQQQIEKGKPHNTAIRSLAFKWIRIAFRCWKTNTPYNETKYLEALKQRGSPLLEYALKS